MYSKRTEIALAAVSRLAEVHAQGARLSAAEIASCRHLPTAAVARVLTTLARVGLVTGAPGPGGGYTLSRPPSRITVHDIYRVFEDEDATFDLGRLSADDEPGPIDEKLDAVRAAMNDLLFRTDFGAFEAARTEADTALDEGERHLPRETYRAPLAGRARRA